MDLHEHSVEAARLAEKWRDRKGTTKKVCDKDFAERSDELSGAIASKPLFYRVMTGNPLELFTKFFGAVCAIFWLCGSFLAPKKSGEAEHLAHQDCTIAIDSDFCVDRAKSADLPQKEWVLGSDVAARNRKSLATFQRTLDLQWSIALSCLIDN